jgi:hypothetical protein
MGILKEKSSFAKNTPPKHIQGQKIIFADEKGEKLQYDVFEENLHYSSNFNSADNPRGCCTIS